MKKALYIYLFLGFFSLFSQTDFTEKEIKEFEKRVSLKEVDNLIHQGFFKGVKHVLDLGCGEGTLTCHLAKKLPSVQVLGCDVSETMIKHAKNRFKENNLKFMQQDIKTMSFFEKFERLISFNSFHWVDDQKVALEKAYQALKPGGYLFILATPESKTNDYKSICTRVILTFRWLMKFSSFKSVHTFLSLEEYENLLIQCGFKIKHIDIVTKEETFTSKEDLEEYFYAVLSPLKFLKESRRPAFFSDLYKEIGRQGKIDPRGIIHIYFDEIEIQAFKDS